MSKVYAFLANGFEEVECLAVVDLLRRANIDVDMVSITNNKYVTGSHSITVQADVLFDDADFSDADMLFLPGGMPGTKYLATHEALNALIKDCYRQNKHLAAICAAPIVYGEMNLLSGKHATCYPGFEEKCMGAVMEKTGVVTDGCITTARGLGFAIDLGLELIRILENDGLAAQVKSAIQHPCAE